jgi:hypothetical protein
MRILFPLALLAAAQIGAAWAIGEPNTARVGGVLATAATETAEGCERLCRDDTLCMAWTFEAGLCRTSANVPSVVTRAGAVSGLSARAPRTMQAPVVSLSAPPPAPIVDDEPFAENAAPAPPTPTEDLISAELLGGPEEEDLRTRLGN